MTKTPQKHDGDWCVMRQDYSDVVYIMASHVGLSEEFAKSEAQRYQKKGHHQTYWAEKMDEKHKNGHIPTF
ncbi:MAG: hypothetical protein ACPG05_00480 [Bdellovibrionales bacterium]